MKERSVWAACGVYGGRELTACFQTSRRTAYLAQESTTEDATKFAEKTVWTCSELRPVLKDALLYM